VLADRAEEARERDELPDADGLLRPHDGGEGEVVGPGRGAGGGEREEVAAGGTGRHVATAGHRGTAGAESGQKMALPGRGGKGMIPRGGGCGGGRQAGGRGWPGGPRVP